MTDVTGTFYGYPKMNTLWKRSQEKPTKGMVIEGEYSEEYFNSIKNWLVTEKIHGENQRIIMHNGEVFYRGRTDNSDDKPFVYEYLEKIFTLEKMQEKFPDSNTVIIYGETVAPKINSGGAYTKDVKTILFDVAVVDGETNHVWWLEMKNVQDIAEFFGVESVPILGIMNQDEIIELVKSEYESTISIDKLVAEGIVATSYPMMLNRQGNPIRFKLKAKDYKKLSKINGMMK